MCLEFYSGLLDSTTAFTVEREHAPVTALGVDPGHNIWTGHARGMLRVRLKGEWQHLEEKSLAGPAGAPLRVIAFDDQGAAWVGDDAGHVKVWGERGGGGCVEHVERDVGNAHCWEAGSCILVTAAPRGSHMPRSAPSHIRGQHHCGTHSRVQHHRGSHNSRPMPP
eukprot:161016-Chlamydomonas_euryale.AAC.1